jgi:hypothetical protein
MPFPEVTLLDSFKRANESPLSNGSKWKNLYSTENLQILSEACTQGAGGGSVDYWYNPAGGAGVACATTISKVPPSGQFIALRLAADLIKNNGYWFVNVTGGSCRIGKFEEGSETTLAEKTNVPFESGDRMGLIVKSSHVSGWRWKAETSTWEELFEATDSTYSTGHIALQLVCTPEGGQVQNFEAGLLVPELTNPGTQTNFVKESVVLKIKSTFTTEYEAIGLPEGLSINSSTGEITGEPKKEETVKVKLKVKGLGGEASDEFEWIITSTNSNANVLGMILS